MLKLYVCIGSACHLKGSSNVVSSFQNCINEHNLENKVEVSGTFCLGRCGEENSVSVKIENEIFSVNPEQVNNFFEDEVLKRI